uniref:Uncharacterized protein n=1 Tax=Arundo donax TaxID=35708 RepID=A0A0A9FSM6_ARUDO
MSRIYEYIIKLICGIIFMLKLYLLFFPSDFLVWWRRTCHSLKLT